MIHELDRHSFELHNTKVEPDYRFLSQLAPEPWIGDTKANLLVLLANPGATRGKADWFKHVPELSKYKRYFQPASPQCAYISPKNYGQSYKEILNTIS